MAARETLTRMSDEETPKAIDATAATTTKKERELAALLDEHGIQRATLDACIEKARALGSKRAVFVGEGIPVIFRSANEAEIAAFRRKTSREKGIAATDDAVEQLARNNLLLHPSSPEAIEEMHEEYPLVWALIVTTALNHAAGLRTEGVRKT